MPYTETKLKIADTIIALKSRFPHVVLSKIEYRAQFSGRFKSFFYNGNRRPNIIIDIKIRKKLPQPKKLEDLFITYHPDDDSENWRLSKKGNTHIYKCPVGDKKQIMFVNKSFDRVKAYLLPKKDQGFAWNITDIIYDFLQVLLITYFAQRESAIFVHAVGVRDIDGKGFVFAGKSGAGKSTTAEIWYRHSRARVLNDDRMIIKRHEKKFRIYGSPWHGSFTDYLDSSADSAPLSRIFFLHHVHKNTARWVSPREAFAFLYPAVFPTFWDKDCLEKIVSFYLHLVRHVHCFHFGFVNDKRIINFIRNLKRR